MRLIDKLLTEKQKKFAEIYVMSSGILSNTECAIEAGYDIGNAETSKTCRSTRIFEKKTKR